MLIYVADAFTDRCFGGNPAGIVLLDREHTFPGSHCMQKLAAELKHSETAFVLPDKNHRFHIRYFTPVREVDLCGHATICRFCPFKTAWLCRHRRCLCLHTFRPDHSLI